MIDIGIDPDTEKSGVAVYDSIQKDLELRNLPFWELIDELESYIAHITVVVEGGWLNTKSNWHGAQGRRAEKIAKNVGMNHQVGILIVEYCKHKGINCEVVKPLKLIRGKKITAEQFKAITGYEGRTNQEVRDAAMLVFGRK